MQQSKQARINQYLAEKKEYMGSLKNNLHSIATECSLATFGIFEKIRDVIPETIIDESRN